MVGKELKDSRGGSADGKYGAPTVTGLAILLSE